MPCASSLSSRIIRTYTFDWAHTNMASVRGSSTADMTEALSRIGIVSVNSVKLSIVTKSRPSIRRETMVAKAKENVDAAAQPPVNCHDQCERTEHIGRCLDLLHI